jgi:hypothetical protein
MTPNDYELLLSDIGWGILTATVLLVGIVLMPDAPEDGGKDE